VQNGDEYADSPDSQPGGPDAGALERKQSSLCVTEGQSTFASGEFGAAATGVEVVGTGEEGAVAPGADAEPARIRLAMDWQSASTSDWNCVTAAPTSSRVTFAVPLPTKGTTRAIQSICRSMTAAAIAG